METMLFALHAVLPLLLLIAVGYVLRLMRVWEDPFFVQLNRLCFRLFLPIQLFCNVYSVSDLSVINWKVIGFILLCVPCAILLGAVCAKLFLKDQNQKGVLVQAAFRSNQALIGVPLAGALGGAEALAFASISSGFGVAAFNFFAVVVLNLYYRTGKKADLAAIGKNIVTNPLIIGTMSGLACVGLRTLLPQVDGVPVFTLQNQLPSVYQALSNMSKVATPVMLICLGARLNFGAVKGMLPQLILGVFLRLVAVPGLAIGTAVLLRTELGLSVVEMPTLVAFFATPAAVSSAVMVQEIGGDSQYANQLVVWSSVLSMLTIFLFIVFLRTYGLL